MVWAINPAGDSLFTQNDNLSLLEVNNISLVVLLVKKKKKMNPSLKYDGNTQKWLIVLVFVWEVQSVV